MALLWEAALNDAGSGGEVAWEINLTYITSSKKS